MTKFLEFMADHPEWFVPLLVLAEVTVVCGLALLALRVFRNDAAARYGIGVVSLLMIWVCVPATLWLQSSGYVSLAWKRVLVETPIPYDLIPADMPILQEPASPPNWVLILWVTGSLVAFLRLGHGAWRVWSLRRGAFPLELKGVKSPVLVSDEVSGPVVVGPVQPAVGSSRVDLQACKLEYSIVSPK